MRFWLSGIMMVFCVAAFGQVGVGSPQSQSQSQSQLRFGIEKGFANFQLPSLEICKFPIRENSRNSWLTLSKINFAFQKTSFAESRKPNTGNEPQSILTAPAYLPESVLPKHYGFFCKVESMIEKKSRLAPRFRLGSVDYVDALEGKYSPVIK